MAGPTVFISYRHGVPSTDIADTVYTALSAVAEGMGFEIFMDKSAVPPAELVDQKILDGLNQTTHFLALLDNDYWASEYCKMELHHAIRRWENHENIRLLFVMADTIKPQYLTFKGARASGALSAEPLIQRVGDLQFLGPFDEGRRLVRLKYENRAELRDQIGRLIDELARILP